MSARILLIVLFRYMHINIYAPLAIDLAPEAYKELKDDMEEKKEYKDASNASSSAKLKQDRIVNVVDDQKEKQTIQTAQKIQIINKNDTRLRRNSIWSFLPFVGLGIAIGIAGGLIYYKLYHSESALIESNRSLNKQVRILKVESNILRDELEIYKTIDINNRDGRIKALEAINGKYEQQLNTAKKEIGGLKEELSASRDEVNTFSGMQTLWDLFVAAIPSIALCIIGNQANTPPEIKRELM